MELEVEKSKPVARLENWYFGEGDLLYGECFDHPRLPDGAFIRTSRVVNKDTGQVETLNTIYKLGKKMQGFA